MRDYLSCGNLQNVTLSAKLFFFAQKNRIKNAPKPTHALDSQTILASYPNTKKVAKS